MKGKVKPSFWEVASPEKQFERLRKSFEKYVVKSKNGCWGWKGSLAKKYPSLQYGGKYKSIGAHRASWLIYKGAIPKDMYICHSCDNPVCTNPDHLFIGTPSDNVVDMIKKRRNRPPKGENAPGAKLKECEVIEIKKLLKTNMSMAAIAKIFNVAVPTIFDIKENKTWRHIII